MNWLNIYTPTLRAPEFIGSDPVARATWLYVFAYCAEQENGGRIVGARSWKDRQWQQTCGVTIAEVEASAPLLTWDGNDLLLFAYPSEKQEEIQRKREGGKRGGKASGKARREALLPSSIEAELEACGEAELQAELQAELEACGEAELQAELERKGKGKEKIKGNGKEGEEEVAPRKRVEKMRVPTWDEVIAFFRDLSLPQTDAEWFFHKGEGNGWTNGGKPMKSWAATVRSWKAAGYLPSQKNGPAQSTIYIPGMGKVGAPKNPIYMPGLSNGGHDE